MQTAQAVIVPRELFQRPLQPGCSQEHLAPAPEPVAAHFSLQYPLSEGTWQEHAG